jgi:hypothetical protein
MHLHVCKVPTYEDIACIGTAVFSVRQCQTPEVDRHSLTAIQELAAGLRLLVTHEAMYAIICHRLDVVWLQVLSALYFDRTDLTSLKTILCCLSQPHAETRTTEPKQAASRFVVFSAPTEVFVSLTWHAFVFRRASCPSNSSQVFSIISQYVLITCDMYKAYTPIPVVARSKAWVCSHLLAGIAGLNPDGASMSVSCECCVLSSTGLCDGPITRPEVSYRTCHVWV